jgi:recombination protein RecA
MASRKKEQREVSPAHKPGGFAERLLEELNRGEEFSPAQLLGSDGMAIKIRGVISTQCATLDKAIGRGGIPLGRVTMLWGKEGAGKSTLALHCVAEAQARGGMAIYIDSEHKLDPDYAKVLGVDTDHLVILQPRYLEAAFEKIEVMVNVAQEFRSSGQRVPILVVLDSIDATKAKATVEGEWDQQLVTPEQIVWSRCLPKLVPMLSREDIALLLVSQVRDKIGVMYGSKERTAGGNAPRFYASLLMQVSRKDTIKGEGEEAIGNRVEVYIAKNQIAPPFRRAEFTVIYGKGIDYVDSILKEALKVGIVERAHGGWLAFAGESYHGEEGMVRVLKDNPELKAKLLSALETGVVG